VCLGVGLAADEQAAIRRLARSRPGRCIDAELHASLTDGVCTLGDGGRVHPGHDVGVFLEALDKRNEALSPGEHLSLDQEHRRRPGNQTSIRLPAGSDRDCLGDRLTLDRPIGDPAPRGQRVDCSQQGSYRPRHARGDRRPPHIACARRAKPQPYDGRFSHRRRASGGCSMGEKSNREVVEPYMPGNRRAGSRHESSASACGLCLGVAQSGERVRGVANAHAIAANYPGGLGRVQHRPALRQA
jgi:hypothetical protein